MYACMPHELPIHMHWWCAHKQTQEHTYSQLAKREHQPTQKLMIACSWVHFFFILYSILKGQTTTLTVTWYIRRTWQELGGGEYALLYLPALGEELCGRHGKLQTVPDHLTGFQSTPAHHWRLHGPCVLLPKAVTDFLEGHGVQALRVWNVKMQKSVNFNSL